jgi:hypothetical protein
MTDEEKECAQKCTMRKTRYFTHVQTSTQHAEKEKKGQTHTGTKREKKSNKLSSHFSFVC